MENIKFSYFSNRASLLGNPVYVLRTSRKDFGIPYDQVEVDWEKITEKIESELQREKENKVCFSLEFARTFRICG